MNQIQLVFQLGSLTLSVVLARVQIVRCERLQIEVAAVQLRVVEFLIR